MTKKRATYICLVILFAALCGVAAVVSLRRTNTGRIETPNLSGKVVEFQSGSLLLKGVLYTPEGQGPFRSVLFNHGSAPGLYSNEAIETFGQLFASRGWLFFAPYRRGQGLSDSAGAFIGDELEVAERHGGTKERNEAMVRLLSTDHLADQLAGAAWLKRQPFVRQNRVAVFGNSFGGIETVLGAATEEYCAAINASGAAQTWAENPELQSLLIRSIGNSKAPMFFFQAENDYNLAPTRVLSGVMKQEGMDYEVKFYPPFGASAAAGHSFSYRGSSVWAEDAFRFLDRYCS